MSYNNTFACSSLNFHEYPAFCRYFTLTPQVLFLVELIPCAKLGLVIHEVLHSKSYVVAQLPCVIQLLGGGNINFSPVSA